MRIPFGQEPEQCAHGRKPGKFHPAFKRLGRVAATQLNGQLAQVFRKPRFPCGFNVISRLENRANPP